MQRTFLISSPAPESICDPRRAARTARESYSDTRRIPNGTRPTAEELAALANGRVTIGLATYANARFHAPPHPDVAPHLAYALAEHPTSSRAAFAAAHAAVGRVPFGIRRVSE